MIKEKIISTTFALKEGVENSALITTPVWIQYLNIYGGFLIMVLTLIYCFVRAKNQLDENKWYWKHIKDKQEFEDFKKYLQEKKKKDS